MRTLPLDIAATAGILGIAAVAAAFWFESRETGRYELVGAEVTVTRFQGRRAEPDRAERRLFRIDTRTGYVETLNQIVYEDTAFVTHQGFWTPVDTVVRFPRASEAP